CQSGRKVFSGKSSYKDSSFGENFLMRSSIPNVECEKRKFYARQMSFEALRTKKLTNGAKCLIYGNVGVRGCTGVSIGNGDSAMDFAADLVRRFARRPLRVKKRVVLVAVTMRPPVYRDGFDIATRIESATRKTTSELIADIAFEGFE